MKLKLYLYRLAFTVLFLSVGFQKYSSATVITAVASGNWNATTTWNPSQIPTANDTVVISAFSITADTDAACLDLVLTATPATLTIDTLVKVVVWGNLVVNGTGSGNGAITGRGILNFSPSNHTITGTATISVRQFITTVGSTNFVVFLGTGDIGGPAILSFTGDSVTNASSGPLIYVNAGAELTFSSSTKLWHGSIAVFRNDGKLTVNNTAAGALTTKSSTKFTNYGTIIMNGGATGTLAVGSSSNFTNYGTLTFNGTATNALTIGSSSTFLNDVTGVITFAAGVTGNNITGPGSGYFTNNGIINTTANINLLSSVRWTNTGTINSTASVNTLAVTNNSSLGYCINEGTINSTGTGNISIANSSSFQNQGTVTIAGNITGTNATSSVWTQVNTNSVLNIAGVLLATGTLNADYSHNTVKYYGSAQTIKTPSSSRYDKLEIATGSTATISANIIVNTLLTLTDGKLNTGSYTLIVDSTASVSGGSSVAYVNGNLQKNFPVETSSASSFKFEIGDGVSYTPVDLVIASIAAGGSVKANTVAAEHPAILSSNLDPAFSVNRYWTLTNTGIVFTTAAATFNWVNSDEDGVVTVSNFSVGKYNNPTWTYPTVANPQPNSIQATGLTSFSDFAVAEINGTGMPILSDRTELILYPNPTHNGSFVLDLNNIKNGTIRVFNCQGKEVYNEPLLNEPSNKKIIDLKAGAGIYFVSVIDGDKRYFQKVVIK